VAYMVTVIGLIFLVALFWGGWPLVARSAGEGNPFYSLVLIGVALIPVALMASFQSSKEMILATSLQTFERLAFAGLMMGLGLVSFNTVVSNRQIEISALVPVINVSMMMVTVIGGIWFFNESLTPAKIIGLICFGVGIILVRPV